MLEHVDNKDDTGMPRGMQNLDDVPEVTDTNLMDSGSDLLGLTQLLSSGQLEEVQARAAEAMCGITKDDHHGKDGKKDRRGRDRKPSSSPAAFESDEINLLASSLIAFGKQLETVSQSQAQQDHTRAQQECSNQASISNIVSRLDALQTLCHDTAAMGMQHAQAVLGIGLRIQVLEKQVANMQDEKVPEEAVTSARSITVRPPDSAKAKEDSNKPPEPSISDIQQQYAESALKVFGQVSSIETRVSKLEENIRAEIQQALRQVAPAANQEVQNSPPSRTDEARTRRIEALTNILHTRISNPGTPQPQMSWRDALSSQVLGSSRSSVAGNSVITHNAGSARSLHSVQNIQQAASQLEGLMKSMQIPDNHPARRGSRHTIQMGGSLHAGHYATQNEEVLRRLVATQKVVGSKLSHVAPEFKRVHVSPTRRSLTPTDRSVQRNVQTFVARPEASKGGGRGISLAVDRTGSPNSNRLYVPADGAASPHSSHRMTGAASPHSQRMYSQPGDRAPSLPRVQSPTPQAPPSPSVQQRMPSPHSVVPPSPHVQQRMYSQPDRGSSPVVPHLYSTPQVPEGATTPSLQQKYSQAVEGGTSVQLSSQPGGTSAQFSSQPGGTSAQFSSQPGGTSTQFSASAADGAVTPQVTPVVQRTSLHSRTKERSSSPRIEQLLQPVLATVGTDPERTGNVLSNAPSQAEIIVETKPSATSVGPGATSVGKSAPTEHQTSPPIKVSSSPLMNSRLTGRSPRLTQSPSKKVLFR